MRTYNIPIFVPHRGCPHDCVFCNQKRITGSADAVTASDAERIIEEYLRTLPDKDENTRIEAAYFGGSFTGIPMGGQNALLGAAKRYIDSGMIDGIRISTRPDYIDREILDNLLRYGVTTIELGVQSMDDEVLKRSNRGHTRADVINAVKLIKEYPFTLGLQMMTGLPGDTDEKSLKTADDIIALRPQLARIYPTLTIKDTYLEEMYQRGEYAPQSLSDAVELAKRILLKFEKNGINVIRVGLQSTDEISEGGSVVAGPLHSAFGELVESSIYFDLIADKLKNMDCRKAYVYVSPREMSKAAGNKKCNVRKIMETMGIEIKIRTDENLQKREVKAVAVKKA